ncbi:hypothetical protein Sango_1144500 [Sesamum angolense]|uniref:Reverse transcriptase domain-containing protein n=1 Tax=Sesamum angolense TaxID=2727404 RepID=A0AAE2BWK4_9LAMI|nr:hypothetical protein Sango_1144500 [Sesamum angolense]
MNETLILPYTPGQNSFIPIKRSFNATHIVLIPKYDQSEMPSIILESQSAFVPGQFITDNVLLAYEINHYLAHKCWGKEEYIALKLDISKAYNRVEYFSLRVLWVGDEGVHDLLQRFEEASGLAINWQKSAAVFSKNETARACARGLSGGQT